MKHPVIGITSVVRQDPDHLRYAVICSYPERIRSHGGLPLMIPNLLFTEEEAEAYLAQMDGLLLIGGPDYPPSLYGEATDPRTKMNRLNPESDFILTQAALKTDLPILGICAGHQMLAIVAGGKLIQHLPNADECHTAGKSHAAVITEEGIFPELLNLKKGAEYSVLSFHHQAADRKTLPPCFKVTSLAFDGTVETMEHREKPFVVGVQFHPERMEDSFIGPLFDGFIQQAAHCKEKKSC